MPKVRDKNTGEEVEVQWNLSRDPTPEEMDILVRRARAKAAPAPQEPGIISRASDKISEVWEGLNGPGKQVETGVQTPFGPEKKTVYAPYRPSITTKEAWKRPQGILIGGLKDIAKTGVEFSRSPMGIPVNAGMGKLLELISPETAAKVKDQDRELDAILEPKDLAEEGGASLPMLAEFGVAGGAATKASKGASLLARMAAEGGATGAVERGRGGDLESTAIATLLGAAPAGISAGVKRGLRALKSPTRLPTAELPEPGLRELPEGGLESPVYSTEVLDAIKTAKRGIPTPEPGLNTLPGGGLESPAYSTELFNAINTAKRGIPATSEPGLRTLPTGGLESPIASTELLDAIKAAKTGELRRQGTPVMLEPFDQKGHPFELNSWNPLRSETPPVPGGITNPVNEFGPEAFERSTMKYTKPVRDKKTGRMVKSKKPGPKGGDAPGREFDITSRETLPESVRHTPGELQEAKTSIDRTMNMINEAVRRTRDRAAWLLDEPELNQFEAKFSPEVTGQYRGKRTLELGNKRTNTIDLDPINVLIESKDTRTPDDFVDILREVLAEEFAHSRGLHNFPNKDNLLAIGGGKSAIVSPELRKHELPNIEKRAAVNPEEHRFLTGKTALLNDPEFNAVFDQIRVNLKRDPEWFYQLKRGLGTVRKTNDPDIDAGIDPESLMPSGEWNPRRVIEAARKSGGKGIKQEGNKISWTAADGSMKTVEIGKDRIGKRTFGLGAREQGTSPRQIGLNPRSPLPENIGAAAPEPKWTKETGALRIGPRTPQKPVPPDPNAPRKATLGEQATDVINISRNLKSAIDLSMPIRQAGLFTAHHPLMAAKAAKGMIKSAFSEKEFSELAKELAMRPNALTGRYSKAGLALTSHPQHALAGKIGQIGNREEAFLSTLAENLPLVGPAVRGSNRAAVAFLNQARADMFDKLSTTMKEMDVPDKDIAKYVNIITGRAGLGKTGEKYSGALQAMLFSPRFLASRVQSLTHMVPGTGLLHPKLQKELGKDWAAYTAAIGSVLGLSQLAGAKVEYNPKSSNYLKIRFGKTHIDIGGSYPQLATFFAQVLSGERKTASGKIESTGRRKDSELKKRVDTGLRFGRSKLNPPAGLLVDAYTGKNYIGEKFDVGNPWHWGREATDLVTPMYPSDLFESVKEHGAGKGSLVSLPSLVGGNVNIYDPKEKKDPNKFKKEVMELWNSRLGKGLREVGK